MPSRIAYHSGARALKLTLSLIARITDRAGHLPPARHFAFEIVRRLALVLDHHVEPYGLELLLRRRLPHDRIDLRIELRDHRIGRLRRREEADPRARIDVGKPHLAVSRYIRHGRIARRARKPDAAQKPLRDG